MTYDPMRDLAEFHQTFAPEQRNDDMEEIIHRRVLLIEEEYEEVQQALTDLDRYMFNLTSFTAEEVMTEVASELADLLYVVYGTAEELGIPLTEVFQEIHRANMSKVWDDGAVHRNGYGKIIKPPNFVKADVRKVLYGQSDNTERG